MKPKVVINLNIDMRASGNESATHLKAQMEDTVYRAKYICDQIRTSFEPEPPTRLPKGPAPQPPPVPLPLTRHYQAVAANQRISEAIGYIDRVTQTTKSGAVFDRMMDLKKILLSL